MLRSEVTKLIPQHSECVETGGPHFKHFILELQFLLTLFLFRQTKHGSALFKISFLAAMLVTFLQALDV